MKILLAFPFGDLQTGVYIRNAFESVGCEVVSVDSKENPQNVFTDSEKHNPDIVFCSREIGLLSEIQKIRENLPDIKTVCYNVDSRHSVKEWGKELLSLFNNVHIYYCKPEGNIEESQKCCPDTTVHCLLEGIDPTEHKKEEITESDFSKYGFDVVFAGSKNEIYKTPIPYGRIGLINFLEKQDFDFKTVSFNPIGSGRFLGTDHNKLCQCSKIVLGHCGWADVRLSNSARDFRVTGAGGFLLTEYVDGMEDLFELGKECETYKTLEECVEKIKYYIEHEEERKRIAESGYLRTIKDHTFANRMKQVLNDVRKYKCQQ